MAYTKTAWVNNSSPYINANNLNKIENQLETNTTNIQTNTEKITNIIGTILWTNQNPTSDFSQQTITLSSSDYDLLEIIYDNWNSQNNYSSVRIPKGKNASLHSMIIEANTGFIGVRTITYVTDTSLSVSNNIAIVDGNSFSNLTNNEWGIPIYIIGYKTELF